MQKNIFYEMSEIQNIHWWFISRKKIIEKIFRFFLPSTKKMKILDMGCGTGSMFDLLSVYGEVHGIDIADEALNACSKYGYKSLNHIDLLGEHNTFDIIVMLDVLEHIKDDRGFLEKIKKNLKDESLFCVTVPANKYLWSYHDDVHGHYRRYNKMQLMKLFEKEGYKIKYCSYFNFFLFAPIFCVRLLNRMLNLKNSSDLKKTHSLFNNILKFIMSFEKYLLPFVKFPCGVSLILIAEK